MKHPPSANSTPTVFKYFLLSLPFLLLLLLLLHSLLPQSPPPHSSSGDLRIRPGYTSYEAYIRRQLNKTLDPRLRRVWTTRDWDRKVSVFTRFFSDLQRRRLLSNSSRALCVGAHVGQEVEALRRVGVADSIGINLIPSPPFVVEGDFHRRPFADGKFDFEFSNVFDHALYADRFVGEIERTLKPAGVCALHVALRRHTDKYSTNDLFSVRRLVELFKGSELVHVRKVDGSGLDTELVLRRKKRQPLS